MVTYSFALTDLAIWSGHAVNECSLQVGFVSFIFMSFVLLYTVVYGL